MCKVTIDKLFFSYRIKIQDSKSILQNGVKLIPALRDVNLNVKRGDKVALLGDNGSGKSTLLKIIGGALLPDKGSIGIKGDMLSLLNRGLGLIPPATLYENAKIKGASLGLKSEGLEEFIVDSVQVADLPDRLHDPLNSLSAGMFARFSLAVNSRVVKQITILDEWIGATGVVQVKKNGLLNQLQEKTDILIFASHNEAFVRELSNRAVVLENGAVVYDGDDIEDGLSRIKRL